MKEVGRITLSVALIAAFAATPATAQSAGILGGLNLSELFGRDVQRAETRSGLNAGGSFTLINLGPIAIGPEIFYAQKGAGETRLAAETPEFFDQFGLDYIEVPILARGSFPIPGIRHLRGYLQGGPAFAWRLDCRIEQAEGGTARVNDGCAINQFGNGRAVIQAADRGAVMGAGLDVVVPPIGSINIDGRLVRGLTRVSESADGPDIRNRAFSVMLGFSRGW